MISRFQDIYFFVFQLEAKIILSKFIRDFDFVLDKNQSLEVEQIATLRPKGEVTCYLSERTPNGTTGQSTSNTEDSSRSTGSISDGQERVSKEQEPRSVQENATSQYLCTSLADEGTTIRLRPLAAN
jgi:hypothetical protein